MTEFILPTRNKPRRHIVGTDMTSKHSIRVYRASPEDILLQIRRDKDYIAVALTFVEAQEIISALTEALPPDA